jgi:predicted MFS family arabinose efflux permease
VSAVVPNAHEQRLPLGLLAAAGFLSSAGARVIDSLLDAIARDFSVGIPAVAIVLAAFTIPYGALQLVVGPLGDRIGKPRVLAFALIGYALATAGCALAANLPQLILLRACAGACSAGLIPVCLAYIADGTRYEERQVTLSRFLTGVVAAQMLAGPVGGAFGQFVTWRGVFLLLSAAALVLAGLLLLRMKDLSGQPRGQRITPAAYAGLLRSGPRLLLLATLVDGIVFAGTFPFIAPYLHERYALPYSAVGLVLACFGVGTFAYIAGAARLLRWLGERGLVLLGSVVAAAGLALAVSSSSWMPFILVEALLGLGYFMLHGVLQARATEMLPGARGAATSSFAFMLFMGQALGALAVGSSVGAWGYDATFAVDAAFILLLGGGLWQLLRA